MKDLHNSALNLHRVSNGGLLRTSRRGASLLGATHGPRTNGECRRKEEFCWDRLLYIEPGRDLRRNLTAAGAPGDRKWQSQLKIVDLGAGRCEHSLDEQEGEERGDTPMRVLGEDGGGREGRRSGE